MFILSNFGSTQVKVKEILNGDVPAFLQAFIKSLVFNSHITCGQLIKYISQWRGYRIQIVERNEAHVQGPEHFLKSLNFVNSVRKKGVIGNIV